MDKRAETIILWVALNCPEHSVEIEQMLNSDLSSQAFLLGVGFEAGRMFQARNPERQTGNPEDYKNHSFD